MKKLTLLFMLLIAGCSSPSKLVRSANPSTEFAFPLGLYKHDVQLTIVKSSENFHFNGLVRLEPKTIQVVALSPFGITLFKINDDLETNQIKTEIYVDQMKRFEPRILSYYEILKKMLTLKSSAIPAEQIPIRLDDTTLLKVGKYDQNHIPESMKIQNPNYEIEIKVTGYEI